MTVTSDPSPFNETDFRAIETAVLETEKGRWFLNEFGRRNRVADTQTLLSALGRLERNLTSQSSLSSEEQPDLAALSGAISATCEDISSVRNDMLNGNAQIPDDKPVFAHLSESAHQIAVDLIATAEALQGTVNVLRKDSSDQTHVDTMDTHVHSLFDEGWRQDILAQRVSKAMGLLEHLDQNLKILASTHGAESEASMADMTKAIPFALTEENLKFFDGDNDMFAKEEAEQPGTKKPDLEVHTNNDDESRPDERQVEQVNKDTPTPETIDTHVTSKESETAEDSAPARETDDNAPTQETQDQLAAEPAPPVTPPQEPNVVIIRRGRRSNDEPVADETAAEGSETTVVESEVQETAVTPSITGEKHSQAAEAQGSDPNSPQDTEAESSTGENAEPSEAQETRSKSDTNNLLADIEARMHEEPGTDSDVPDTSDAMSAFTDMAAQVPKTEDPETQNDEPADCLGSDEDEERIVIIRHTSSEDTEIPFADYLGVETDPHSKTDSAS